MRDLRGQRSEDVIYAGPRKMLGASEVSLTFENTGTGSDPSWSELCIARRLYRSGESDYLVNRRKARLRDVVGALHDLGIDSGRHVVVTQGMADSLLSATPLERRALLEQAAGLAGYRDRRDEARHKLATTAQNIETIEAVLAEMEPRLRLLRRQARAIEEREEANARLQARLLAWYGWRWRQASHGVEELSAAVETVAAERKSVIDRLNRLEEQSAASLERERSWHRQLEAATAALYVTERERADAAHAVERLEQRLASVERTLSSGREREVRLQPLLHEAEKRFAAVSQTVHALRAERAEVERAHAGLHSALAGLRRSAEERARLAAASRRTQENALRAEADARLQLERLESRLQQLRKKTDETDGWLRDCDTSLQTIDAEANEVSAALREREQETARQEEALAAAEREVALQKRRLDRMDRLRNRLRTVISETARRLALAKRSLDALDREVDGGILRTLVVSPGWEQAIAAALGDWALAGYGEAGMHQQFHPLDAAEFLSWRGGLDRCIGNAALWAETVVEGLPPGVASPLLSTLLVHGDAEAGEMWEWIANLPAHTIGSPPVQVVTREGRCWNSIGIKRYGQNEAGRYLEIKREVADLQRKKATAERRLTALESARKSSAGCVAEAEQRARAVSDVVRTARRQTGDLAESSERLARRRSGLEAERRQRQAELAEVAQNLGLESGRSSGLKAAAAQARQEVAAATRAWEGAERAAQDERRRVTELLDQVGERKRSLEVLAAKEAAQLDVLAAAERDVSRLADDIEAVRKGQEEQIALVQTLTRDGDLQSARLRDLNEVAGEQSRHLDAVQAQRPRATEHAGELREARDRLSAVISRHERALAGLMQAESELRQLHQDVRRELAVEPAELPSDVLDPPGDDEIRRLRARAVQYADADPSVVEECRELGERQQYLQYHLDDLKTAGQNLRTIMAIADREMRSRFQSAFAAVSDEFSRVFRVMLRGGEARLEQIDDDGGIEIRAQLPGRRARSSTAFSGGERALVASSLLFGVLKIRPTPFCILDEVDAALDESNVDRYLNVLREISQGTQMIVVTHNRATMAAADVLYGLTMDDEGESSVLSLRLGAYGAAV